MASPSSREGRWAAAVILLAGAGFVFGVPLYFQSSPPVITSTTPVYEDLEDSVNTMGKLLPINDFQARANFSGMIEDVPVRLGDHVRPGQLLVKMKDPFAFQRVASATAALQGSLVGDENIHKEGSQEDRINFAGELAHAKMEQQAATNNLAALRELAKTGVVSDAEINGATQRLQAADTTLKTISERNAHRYSAADKASWSARVADARANLEAQKITLANANLTSPIAGTVYLVPVKSYDFVPAGADLLHIANLDKVEVHALFDEPDLGKLHNDQQVTITWEGRANRTWHGRITRAPLAAMASGVRNVGECLIAVDDANGELLPNTNVAVQVVVRRKPHVLTVPREALHTLGKMNFVYRIIGNRLLQTQVDIGMVTPNKVEIVKGLSPGDSIALHTADNSELRDLLKVRTLP